MGFATRDAKCTSKNEEHKNKQKRIIKQHLLRSTYKFWIKTIRKEYRTVSHVEMQSMTSENLEAKQTKMSASDA